MTITIYSKPACVQCNATYRALDRQGITYEVVDIEQDAQARQIHVVNTRVFKCQRADEQTHGKADAAEQGHAIELGPTGIRRPFGDAKKNG